MTDHATDYGFDPDSLLPKRDDARAARNMRRQAELALLDRLLAEAAMREWYPHQ